MPDIWRRLTAAGAIVNVQIGLSSKTVQAIRKSQQAVPPAKRCRALLDTGAEKTCVDESICRALGFDFEGVELVNLPDQNSDLTFGIQYGADLTILHPSRDKKKNLILRDFAVVELPLQSYDVQILIGRDVLAHCRFLYDGQGDRFVLRY